MFASKCVINTLLLTRIIDAAVASIGPSVVPPPITSLPLPIKAHTGIVARPVVVLAVEMELAVTVVADRDPPTTSEFPFHPIARDPVFILATSA